MPLGLTPAHLLLILVIALIVVGPGKLPDVGASLGKTIKEFRKAASDVQEATSMSGTATATAPAAPAPAAALAPAPLQPPPAPVQAAPVAAVPAPPPAPAVPAPVAPAPVADLVHPMTAEANASSQTGA